MKQKQWFEEGLYPYSVMKYAVDEVIHQSQTSGGQKILIFENPEHGRILALDGIVQLTEKGHHPYHEMMAIMPLMAHGNVKKVLIVGGGDGAMAEHVLRHSKVEEVTLVDIEEGMFELAQNYLQFACKDAFEDKRLKTITGDGAKYVKETHETFDLIIVDSTDPELGDGSSGLAHPLYQSQFHRNCYRRLNDNGILITHSGVPFMQGYQFVKVMASVVYAGFNYVDLCMFDAHDYAGGNMIAVFASKSKNIIYRELSAETLANRFRSAKIKTQYYNPRVHVASFALPQYILNLIIKKG